MSETIKLDYSQALARAELLRAQAGELCGSIANNGPYLTSANPYVLAAHELKAAYGDTAIQGEKGAARPILPTAEIASELRKMWAPPSRNIDGNVLFGRPLPDGEKQRQKAAIEEMLDRKADTEIFLRGGRDYWDAIKREMAVSDRKTEVLTGRARILAALNDMKPRNPSSMADRVRLKTIEEAIAIVNAVEPEPKAPCAGLTKG